jgi:hypothetical protein
MLIIMFLIYLFIEILTSSPFGRLIKAVRENEITARFIGKDVTRIRILVLLIGSSLASIAGVLYSLFMGAVMASAFTRSDWTYWPWLMLIIGGKGNNIGALVGAVIIVIARQLIAIYKHDLELFLPFSVVWLEQILLGITLIAFMIYRPIGIIPEKPVKIRGISFKKIKQEIERIVSSYSSYSINPWSDQPNRIIICIEKEALYNLTKTWIKELKVNGTDIGIYNLRCLKGFDSATDIISFFQFPLWDTL